jgi:SAM-dependent methyltransferase
VQFVLDHARGKRVLDLGCVNHSDQAMNDPNWLHLLICRVAASCIGVDYERASVEKMQAAGIEAMVADVTQPPTEELMAAAPFDLVLAGELIEHLKSPQALLEFSCELLAPGGQLLLTTPNPFALWRARAGQLRLVWESIDHAVYLFPSGVAEMAARTGLRLMLCSTVDDRPSGAIASTALRSGLVALVRRALHKPPPMRLGDAPPVGRLGLRLSSVYLNPAEALLHAGRRRYGQLGETSVYLLENDSRR